MDSDKIGNYIHWKYGNYLKYGLGTTTDGPREPGAQKALNHQKAIVLREAKTRQNLAKESIRAKLEAQLNFFYNTRNGISSEELVQGMNNRTLHESIVNAIQSRFGDLVTVDENLKATISDATMNQKYGQLKEGAVSHNTIALYNRMAYIKKYVDSIANKSTKTARQQGIINDFDNIVKMFEEVLKEAKMTLSDFLKGAVSHNFDRNLINTIEIDKTTITRGKQTFQQTIYKGTRYVKNINENFIQLLNKVVKAVNRASAAYYTGLAGEMYVALVAQVGSAKAQTEAQNIISQFQQGLIDEKIGLVGDQKTYSAMNTRKFGATGKTSNHFFTSFDGGNSIDLKATQDKVDVVITLQEGEILNASVKNYNLSDPLRNITLLTGTNMLKYLTNYPRFVNHYLNITAQPLSESVKKYNYSYRDKVSQGLITEANKTLLITLVLKALAGGVEKLSLNQSGFSNNAKADVFIINDNSTGYFRVFFIEDIINTIMSNYDRILDYVDMGNFSEGFRPGMYWATKYGEGERNYSDAYSRINQLLSQFEAQHLHISLKQNTLFPEKF